jgi:signal transduction histidine kinase
MAMADNTKLPTSFAGPPEESPTEGELTWLRNFVDLGYLVAHEINNLLNNVSLQISIVEMTAPGKDNATLQRIRETAAQTAAKLHRFQQLSQECRPAAELSNLNQIICETVAGDTAAGLTGGKSRQPPIDVDLDPQLPGVLAAPVDLRRLVVMLIEDSRAASNSSQGAIVFRTKALSGRVTLQREDTGPGVPEELRDSMFEPFHMARMGSDGLRLAVCRAIVRRLGGNVHAEEPAEGGLRIVIQFPVAVSQPRA